MVYGIKAVWEGIDDMKHTVQYIPGGKLSSRIAEAIKLEAMFVCVKMIWLHFFCSVPS